ncbi:MAG: transglycosylase domain-containing protein [Chloroflexi bacterium]|nr:transglycosylase domain-containing protein [Chloroflexota bacterium]
MSISRAARHPRLIGESFLGWRWPTTCTWRWLGRHWPECWWALRARWDHSVVAAQIYGGPGVRVLAGSARVARDESLWILAALAWSALSGIIIVFLILTALAGAREVHARVVEGLVAGLPPLESIDELSPPLSANIFDRHGTLLYELFDPATGRREWIPLSQMPWTVQQATIATEDGNFYDNPGFNVRGILRAAYWNMTEGDGRLQGGSSITQQLVKNLFIPPEERSVPSLIRKMRELILAWKLTDRFSKNEILERYLNLVYYGNLSYGIEAAAENYFGKPASELTLAEAALLAGLPQAPALYSPLVNPAWAKAQQELVLGRMVSLGFITSEEREEALQEELHYQPTLFEIRAPHFVVYVKELLEQRYGPRLYRDGLRVTTSLDLDLQQEGERIVQTQVEKMRPYQAANAGLVALRPATGEIIAFVGSADYFDDQILGQVNMALSERQPGSAFKPITYLTAFLKGYTPATVLLDAPSSFPDGINPPYRPESVDGKYRGRVTVRDALASSLNIPAVRALQFAGVQETINVAHRMGINDLNRHNWYGLSLTLGGGEVKLLDLAFTYAVLANNGVMAGDPIRAKRKEGFRSLDPVAILKVETAAGEVLEEFKEPVTEEIVPAPYAHLVTSILSDRRARLLLFSPSAPLFLDGGRPAAVKTGTTDDWRDTWTMGYTPDIVTGVWVGNANNDPMRRQVLSVQTAAPIWKAFMERALEGTPPTPFTRPPGLVEVPICVTSGLRSNGHCPTRTELFVEGTAPKRVEPTPQPEDCSPQTPDGEGQQPEATPCPAGASPQPPPTPGPAGASTQPTPTPAPSPAPAPPPNPTPAPAKDSKDKKPGR